jgi:hypothetical protein
MRRRPHVERNRAHATGEAIQFHIGIGQCHEFGVNLDERNVNAGGADRERKAGGPYPCAKVDHAVTRLRPAGRGKQDRVMTNPVAASWLA